MKIIEQAIDFSGETLVLTNQRAIYWQRKNALILSDLHLGKAAHFRKNGIAMPAQVSLQDAARLELLIDLYKAGQVIIVGDLIHAGANKEIALFTAITGKFPGTDFILIKGNHDRFPESKMKEIGISAVYQELFLEPFYFIHERMANDTRVSINGHIHPGVSLQLPAKKQMRFPCYVVSGKQIILPAFSRFTGLDTLSAREHSVCYAFYEDGIFRV